MCNPPNLLNKISKEYIASKKSFQGVVEGDRVANVSVYTFPLDFMVCTKVWYEPTMASMRDG
jgi:hypothetical protein